VSRINEALHRSDRSADDPSLAAQQQMFVSAWTVAEEAEAASPKPSPEPTPRTPTDTAVRRLRRFSGKWHEVLALPEGSPAMVEQFRRLAAALHNAQASTGIKRLLVTSGATADGKTLTAVNLALVLSQSYRRRVLLVEGDLRRPSLSTYVDLADTQGLSEGLKNAQRQVTVVELAPTLTVLPAGQPDMDPIIGLSSPRLGTILKESSSQFDWVIVDAPPVGPVADASLLAEHVDGVLLVIRAGQTQHEAVQRAIEILGRERILGVVLNGLERMPGAYRYRYRYSSAGEAAEARAD
jgi:capsular exopolysaccharide synthesis family protein